MSLLLITWVTFGLAHWINDVVLSQPRFPFGLMDVILGLPMYILISPVHEVLKALRKI